MFTKLISKVGKFTGEIVIAFNHGYESADTLEVHAKIHDVKKCDEPFHDHNDGCPAQEECPA
jgi:hypothetical protein